MFKINSLVLRSIYDSRGMPTIEAEIVVDGKKGLFSVASGASKGKKEALELRDSDNFGVLNAINLANKKIKPFLLQNSFTQESLDDLLINLDGTKNKSFLGANSLLAISAAFFKASNHVEDFSLYKSDKQVILPLPLINIINGGKHANNNLATQEFMISPIGANTFSQALLWSAKVFHSLKNILHKKKYSIAVGDEGGFAPDLSTDYEALELIIEAIEKAGLKPQKDIAIALDVAAGELYNESSKNYYLNQKFFTNIELLKHYEKIISDFGIFSIEDPFFEEDFEGFSKITQSLGDKIQIVGDDLFVTQTDYIQKGINQKLANALLVKMNQVGTISETLKAVELAKKANWNIIASHRSGETEETFLADFSIIASTHQIKAGSMSRSERLAKYNRLLRIEELLGKKAIFKGLNRA